MKTLVLLLLTIVFAADSQAKWNPKYPKRGVGADPCAACLSCKFCIHCWIKGGTCGVKMKREAKAKGG